MTNSNNNTSEIWKYIPTYGELYEVSSFGRVRSHQKQFGRIVRTRILKPQPHFGYYRISLCKNKKMQRIFVNRLVLMIFDRLPKHGEQASHLDGNRSNNHLSNLVWETPKENNARKYEHGTEQTGERNGFSKLTVKSVQEIRVRAAIGQTHNEIAELYDVGASTVFDVVHRRSWKHI